VEDNAVGRSDSDPTLTATYKDVSIREYRRNHPIWDQWDASPRTSEIKRHRTTVFGPLQLLQVAVIIRYTLWEACSASPDLLAKFKGRRKEEYEREWEKYE